MRLTTTFIIGGLLTLIYSCNQAPAEKTLYEELCECVELGQKVYEEFEAGGSNPEDVENLQEKYKEEFDKCEEVTKELDLVFENLSEEELKEKELEIRAACPALDEQIKEQERMQEEMMQNMMMGDGSGLEDQLDPEQLEALQRMLEEGDFELEEEDLEDYED